MMRMRYKGQGRRVRGFWARGEIWRIYSRIRKKVGMRKEGGRERGRENARVKNQYC